MHTAKGFCDHQDMRKLAACNHVREQHDMRAQKLGVFKGSQLENAQLQLGSTSRLPGPL